MGTILFGCVRLGRRQLVWIHCIVIILYRLGFAGLGCFGHVDFLSTDDCTDDVGHFL